MKFALLVKEVPRSGWNKKFPRGHKCKSRKVKGAETTASHMFGVAFLAMLVSHFFKVNRLKLIEMAIVHDLIEGPAGDAVTVTESGRKRKVLEINKAAKERRAMALIASAGGQLGKKIQRLWLEFEAGKTKEARLFHQLDKLEMCFQAQRYHSQKHKLNPHEFFLTSREYITEPKLLALLSQLEKKCKEP